jgi:hypothetical protein
MPTIHENDSAEKIRGGKGLCKALQIPMFVEASGVVGYSLHRPLTAAAGALCSVLSSLLREKAFFLAPATF